MNKSSTIVVPVVFAVLVTGCLSIQAATHYVDKANNGADSSPYTTWATAATNIQDAIDASATGDLILVTNGIYDTGGRAWPVAVPTITNRAVVTNSLTVMAVSTNPADTLIVGSPDPFTGSLGTNAVRCVYVGNNCTLAGFTLTNGYTYGDGGGGAIYNTGGGIRCESGSATVSNCIVTCCRSRGYGGGIAYGTVRNSRIDGNVCEASGGGGAAYASLEECTIANNSTVSAQGGGIAFGHMTNCLVIGNAATGYGGGVWGNNGRYSRCTFKNNTATAGGGGTWNGYFENCLFVSNSCGESGGATRGGVLVSCTVVYNTAGSANIGGGGLGLGGIATNCVIYYNSAPNPIEDNCSGDRVNAAYRSWPTYTCTTPTNYLSYAGPVLLTNAPMLVDTNSGNYRLSSVSPCINVGSNQEWMTDAVDLDGTKRIDGWYHIVDMGAYEFFAKGSMFIGY